MSRYEFFWGIEDPASNFYLEDYVTDTGQHLCCSEQGYMLEKANYFNDCHIANIIRKLKRPEEIKKAGQLVKDFNREEWDKVSSLFMYEVVLQKALKSSFGVYLLNLPLETVFVEASPYDLKWGIGLSRHDAIRTQEAFWPGQNRLGKIINEVQKELYNRRSLSERLSRFN